MGELENTKCRSLCDDDNSCVAYATKDSNGKEKCMLYDYCDEQKGEQQGWSYHKRKNNSNVEYERMNVQDAYVLPGKPIKSERLIKQLCAQYSYMCSGYFKDKHNNYRAFFKLTDELKKSGMYPYTILLDNSNGQSVYYRKFASPEELSAAENGTNIVLKNALQKSKEEIKKNFEKFKGWPKDRSLLSIQKAPCDEDKY